MIYLLYGKDNMASRKKLNELVGFFQAKVSDLGIFRVESENFEPEKFEELMRGQTLFQNKFVVVCNKIFESKEATKFIEKNMEKIATSQNVFIFIEDEVEEKILALFKQFAKKTQEFKIRKGPSLGTSQGRSLGGYNPFAIGDALSAKNKTKCWVLFQQALLAGVPAEEIFYKISWQVKALLLIKKNPKETGLHSFVVQKNLNNIKNFTEQELINYSFDLLKVYHNTRRSLEEFPIGLEKFLVNL